MTPSLRSLPKRVAWAMVAASSTLACVPLIATSPLGFVVERTARARIATTKSEQGTTTIDEVRALVGELEAQAEAQRAQLVKTEASLRRARVLLADLERGQAVPAQHPVRPATGPQANPAWPRKVEDLPEQSLAQKTPWEWPAETATPQACARDFGGGYEVEIAEPTEPAASRTIRVRRDGQEIVAFPAHSGSVFLRGGDVLYWADYHPSASGCSIVAYHLRRKEALWKTPLIWIGPDAHSLYANRVNMKLDGDRLIVYRDESNGRSIERLDVETGKTVGHRGRRGRRDLR